MNNLLIQDLSINLIDKKELENGTVNSVFEIGPLERGFGITLGNTLRRICLSHLEGTAITSVRIQGVTHEFTAIKGILEDIVEIILNLKSIVFKTELQESFVVNINFQGLGPIKASDLILPAGVEVVNPDVIIATSTDKDISFIAEMTAKKDRGYILADEHPQQNKSIDTIFIDAPFMPIKKFSYRIEQIRIGESNEASYNKYEKLIVDFISNGAIEPDKALSQAAKLLVQKLTPFMNLTGETVPVFTAVPLEVQKEEEQVDVGIETLNLSVRAYNCLKRANKNTLQDLLHMSTEELMSIKNFGKKSAEEVIKVLNERGYYLTDDPRRNSKLDTYFNQATIGSPSYGGANSGAFM